MSRAAALSIVLALGSCELAAAQELVRRQALPSGGTAPDVAVRRGAGPDGSVDVVYGAGSDAFHLRSTDGGRTFAEPVRVNDTPVFSAMERGPRVAVGGDGTVHVVWSPDRLLGVCYARRAPDAAGFTPMRDLRYEGAGAAEGTTVAAHGQTVLALWLDGKTGEPKNSPVGLPLFARVSRDGGQTFEAAGPLAHDYDGGACACCHLSAGVDPEGRVLIAFRGARDGVRDIFLLRGDAEDRRFRAARLTDDRWVFRGCPMDGPRLSPGKDGPLVAHTVDGRVGWSQVARARVGPCQRPGEPRGKFPLALQRADGAVMLAWVEGPALRWLVTDERGQRLGEGRLPEPSSRPAGFVDADERFVLVY